MSKQIRTGPAEQNRREITRSKRAKIHPGDMFGSWLIIKYSDKPNYCWCECQECESHGREKTVKEAHNGSLLQGKSKRCKKCGFETRDQTNIEKYGAKTVLATDRGKALSKETLMERYGVDNIMKTETTKEKVSQAVLAKYGVDNALKVKEFHDAGIQASMSDEAVAKRKETMQQEYGVDYPLQSQQIMDQMYQTNMERYGVDNIMKADFMREWFSKNNPMKNEEFKQRFFDALQTKYGVNRLTELEAFKKGVIKYKIDDDSLRQYLIKQKIDYVNYDAVHKVFKMHGAQAALEYIENREKDRLTAPELFFAKYFNAQKFDKKPHPEVSFRPDFKFSETLYVNVDGLNVHSALFKKNDYHLKVREAMSSVGLRILQFREDEIYKKPAIIKSILENAQGKTAETIMARKCDIIPIRMGAAAILLNQWHLMGRGQNGTAVALTLPDGEIVSIMTFRKNGDDVEISRFASRLGTVVTGGFGKLVNFIKTVYPNKNIISFCDLRYATGISYERLGFVKESIGLSFMWTDGKNTYSRRYCVAKDGKTQQEVADEMGLVQIYDAGQAKYVLYVK